MKQLRADQIWECPLPFRSEFFDFLFTVSKHKDQKIHNYNIPCFVQVYNLAFPDKRRTQVDSVQEQGAKEDV
jgi:hypothetical protein